MCPELLEFITVCWQFTARSTDCGASSLSTLLFSITWETVASSLTMFQILNILKQKCVEETFKHIEKVSWSPVNAKQEIDANHTVDIF